MNLVEKILKEFKQRGILYHYTNFGSALEILKENKLNPTTQYKNPNERFFCISVTRDKNFHKTADREAFGIGGINVRFELDGDKISEHYKIKPLNYWFTSREIGKDAATRPIQTESEECIVVNSMGLPNVKSYIKKITLFLDNHPEHWSPKVKEVLKQIKEDGIECNYDLDKIPQLELNESLDLTSYLYHGTSLGALIRIAKEGLVPGVNRKGEPTILTNNELYAKSYADRKGGGNRSVILKVKPPKDIEIDNSVVNKKGSTDYKTFSIIPPTNILVKKDNEWVSITDYLKAINLNENWLLKILKESLPNNEIKSTDWYHGTSLENGINILKEGFIKPSEIVTSKTKRFMAPVYNRVYLTQSISEAAGYALFRNNEGGYIIVVNGNDLTDVQPDEDIIADLIPSYKIKDGIHPYQWLVNIAKNYFPNDYEKYETKGDYAYGTALGKKILKILNDNQKLELIKIGKKLGSEGKIKIKSAYKIPESFRKIPEENLTLDFIEKNSEIIKL